MIDPFPGSPPLRLNPIREATDPNKELAAAYREMTEATMRWVEARMKVEAIRAQSRPIRASEAALSDNSDFWAHRHMAGPSPLIARTTGTITPLLRAAASGEIRDPVEALRKPPA